MTTTTNPSAAGHHQTILTTDQERAREHLHSLARVRAGTTEAALPTSTLPRWSVPLLIGPTGSGKGFICQEVARRWGRKPCRRWEVAAWMLATNRSGNTTSEQIRLFIGDHPGGCVVYLAGIDTLAGVDAYNASYYRAVESEILQLLDQACARPACFYRRDGATVRVNALVVVGGRFGRLWGQAAVGDSERGEAWRLADAEPLADPVAVSRWLLEKSGLPVSTLRRLSPEPLVLRPLSQEEVDRLAARLREQLPPALDGLEADELGAALRSAHGWRAVAAVIERAWVTGHEPLPPEPEAGATPPPAQGPPAEPLGMRLGIPFPRTHLLVRAGRFGLHTTSDLERLAYARGYRLPGEEPADPAAAAQEQFGRGEFTDLELTVALLAPFLSWNERGLCRGALLLTAQLATATPQAIVDAARRARAGLIVRHVAWLAVQLRPFAPRWRALLALLPTSRRVREMKPGVMPDEAIRRVFSLVVPA